VTATSAFELVTDGGRVVVHRTQPDAGANASVIVVHGMAEHAARYARFATELAAAGYAVYAPDHRGHGMTAAGRYGVAGRDAWNGILRDLDVLAARASEETGGAPQFVFGHSMGSVLAQRFVQVHGARLAGMVLSGTTGSSPGLGAGVAAARVVRALRGEDAPSPLQARIFASFNAGFPARTGFEWLTRDEAAVQAYVDDERCGFTFSNALLHDMLRGYAETWRRAGERRIPRDLPVLMIAGERDPVGRATAGVVELAERYRALGLRDVEVRVYPDARHELLNETNRDEVVRDVIAWLDVRLRQRDGVAAGAR
jgi:alpha-beta hydrolase superfamily lysophospholipase